MIGRLLDLMTQADERARRRLLGIHGLLAILNLGAWGWAILAFRAHPVLLGTALIAYGLGLRHAVDADHIAAIDNATRKLMQDGQRPVAVGLFFSLGHSTLIVIASLGVALVTAALDTRLAGWRQIGALAGTLVSTGFLFAIALLNLGVLRAIVRAWRQSRAGLGAPAELAPFGLLTRLLSPLFRLVSRSWQLFPLGFLFGLGFDTATEVSLLGMSATQAAHGISPWSALVFPALFCAGMSLVDTLDGHLMLGAYGWAYLRPERKFAYNAAITATSVAVALGVGAIEALGLLSERHDLHGRFWQAINALGEHFGMLGYAIVSVFSACWLGSMLLYHMRRERPADVNAEPAG
ncbi:HoxN/HupN/NixA family nickel/cobalt transporter [Burkholderia gladioli]|uniref:HoxN/HupN/NixA family nickel/cobalt transporter n=1 Tax=Burkholderia gladioli TaxID=28095 RepID=UPI000CDA24F1|nr:HoxN/HupN/NixA family nickel/cobalt transporter [Burkholderia gladioli]KAF1059956.1 High-affinity nickel transport protein [Burkholderia gladioli]MDN7493614.1 HoxN/HupN/NixA family nickel/cobalt transporter [Burkholderia gladioli]POS06483.1 HoxN/HupN/NixA family nickel/cobalt transporter [Burkholderia gladioli]WAG24853.1 HoxN/HupN/NixA family nickel/cobalt transporter [Burkholderia gladioli]